MTDASAPQRLAPTTDGGPVGPVMVIGGAEDKLGERVLLSRFVELAGGDQARIAVISTASSLGDAATELYRHVFARAGAAKVTGLRPETREEANDPKTIEALKDVTGIFMTGGNQLRLSSVIGGTKLGAAALDAHGRGVVVAGTSAGASAVATHMMAFGSSGATPKYRMANVSVGLGLLVNVVVDQHFEQRTRLGRLLAVVAQSPSLIGLGLDEDTAAIIDANDVLEVIGRGSVTIVDGTDVITDAFQTTGHKPMMVSNARLHSLPAGYRFDLRARRVLPLLVAKPEPLEKKPPLKPDLKILESQVLRGPNYWSYDSAIRLLVDLGSLEHWTSNTIPAFNDALIDLLPGLHDHGCSLHHRGGFIERLRDGTWMGHVAEHVALELQRETGATTTRGKTRRAGTPGYYHVVYGYNEEQVGLAAGKLAVRLLNHLVQANPTFDFVAELESLVLLADQAAFGPSTQAILDEAARRDIPYIRLNDQSFVQLGQGKYQQRIRATMTSRTSALGVDIAGDKTMTTSLLASAGLPVPKSETVRSADEAAAVAARIGYPVVLKPLDGNHGRGVSLDLRTEEDVRRSYERAIRQTRSGVVVVESFIKGNDYRVLVIDGHMVAVAERVPAHVIGDGVHSVRELVDITNRDPRRGIGHEKVLTRIKIDQAAEELVKRQGFGFDEIPPKDAVVKLAATANMSTGGISIDRTMEADHDNVEIAEEAARVVGLDVAGIDFLTPDISQPVRETGGAIVEVNAAPGFRMHTNPTEGESQYVAKHVLDLLFPSGTPSRIPIVAVTGSNGKTTTVRMLAHIFKGMGRKVGVTSTDGIYIDERLVKRADASGPKSAQ